mmetsp:Transcript_33857/g.39396  ORF Transcript_33857/g.39396 Transcript_33857/m.39396 type:complete len:129 (-) Transcript_33857:490-876(-)
MMVVLGHWSFTFEDLDQDTRLVISIGGENLTLLGWDGGVSWDQSGHDTSSGFDTQRQWGNVQKKEVLDLLVTLTGQDSSLDGSTVSNGFIRVDGAVWLTSSEEIAQKLNDLWNSGRSSDQDDIVDLVL